MATLKRVHLLISGNVTGVGFRLGTVYIARELGLTGWVRNTESKGVEIMAEGPEEKLQNLLTWVHKGPPLAQVEKVEVEWRKATGEFWKFEVKK